MKNKKKRDTTAPSNRGNKNGQSGSQPDESPTPKAVSPAYKNTPSRLTATWRDASKLAPETCPAKFTAHSSQQPNTQLANILKPLIDLLDEQLTNSTAEYPVDRICGLFGDQVFDGEKIGAWRVMIKLPYDCSYHETLTRTVAAILYRTGSDEKWLPHVKAEDDVCRRPLRFCLEKRAIWVSTLERFVPAFRLLVDAVELDMAAAERQVNALVEYLRDGAKSFTFLIDDYMLF